MSQELQQARYDQLLRRVGAMIGPGAKVSEVLAELFPVIDVERVPGELLLLAQTRICFGAALVTGAVGEVPRTQLFNPADSGKLLTVSSCIISTNANDTVRWEVNAIALPTGIGVESYRDARLGIVTRPTGQIRTESSVASTGATGRMLITADTPILLNDENSLAVLSPGTGLEVGLSGITNTINITFNWRERVAEQSELII